MQISFVSYFASKLNFFSVFGYQQGNISTEKIGETADYDDFPIFFFQCHISKLFLLNLIRLGSNAQKMSIQ